ncbi:hypothetical protein A6A04_10365 [Paramagnetospirillum marisnigri]|uniref:DUF192 domain-containing protein n=1 Tax=Paramagnetospirillum marisnigri TaxID=1285242 RepID=A0A178MY01_9PROT|nr:DUF192 domain-containing protein [Paramagnetospirillum marisnigri]OAN55959.1 hypothetical protein A6A04_10365 [Paramagnetospirillum marisnigri]
MMPRVLFSILMLLVLTGPPALAQSVTFPTSHLDLVTDQGRRHSFRVELASSPDQLAQGLMFRRSLEPDAGMLFDFGQSRPVSMWMKNTLIPLDMLFMDRRGRVVHVEEFAVPGSLIPRGPNEPILGVLELAAGTARRLGLKPGDRVEHPMFKQP